MKYTIWIFALFFSCSTTPLPIAETSAESSIREVLSKQQDAWNEGNLELFMEGYWKSDSLQFIGSSIRYGWQPTLDNYRKNYSTRALMGRLEFDIWQVVSLAPETYLVTGQYTLFRESDQPSGPFTLIFKKIQGQWLIIYDHTS